MEGLTEGRIVHYVLPDGTSRGEHRPAIVVKVWRDISQYVTEGRINIQIFTDFSNDGDQYASGQYWGTSVPYSETPEPGTWHWIEKA